MAPVPARRREVPAVGSPDYTDEQVQRAAAELDAPLGAVTAVRKMLRSLDTLSAEAEGRLFLPEEEDVAGESRPEAVAG